MGHLSMDQAILKLREQDSRYAPAAYHFIRRALDHALRKLKREDTGRPAHVTGKELLEGFRDLALTEFGPLARTVLEEWGITRCPQVGEIVFQLVSLGVLGKNEDDRMDDFQELWSFQEAFDTPFQPQTAPREVKKLSLRRDAASPDKPTRVRSGGATAPSQKE